MIGTILFCWLTILYVNIRAGPVARLHSQQFKQPSTEKNVNLGVPAPQDSIAPDPEVQALSSIEGSIIDNGCSGVKINELNADTPTSQEQIEFIELSRASTNSTLKMDGCYLIIISLQDGNAPRNRTLFNYPYPTINIIINLTGYEMDVGQKYFTVGGPSVYPIPHILMNGSAVQNHFKMNGIPKDHTKRTLWLNSNTIPNGHESPMALLLLDTVHINSNLSLTLKEGGRYGIPISGEYYQFLKTSVKDIIAYGKRAPFESCYLLQSLWNSSKIPKEHRYIYREMDAYGFPDMSINWCTDAAYSTSYKYQIGIPSPSSDNDCQGPEYIFEQQPFIKTYMDPENSWKPPEADPVTMFSCVALFHDGTLWNDMSMCPQCYTSIPQENYWISVTEIAKQRQELIIRTKSAQQPDGFCVIKPHQTRSKRKTGESDEPDSDSENDEILGQQSSNEFEDPDCRCIFEQFHDQVPHSARQEVGQCAEKPYRQVITTGADIPLDENLDPEGLDDQSLLHLAFLGDPQSGYGRPPVDAVGSPHMADTLLTRGGLFFGNIW